MKAFLIVKSKWTDSEYIHPKVFTNESDLKKAVDSWDTTNTTITIKYL